MPINNSPTGLNLCIISLLINSTIFKSTFFNAGCDNNVVSSESTFFSITPSSDLEKKDVKTNYLRKCST